MSCVTLGKQLDLSETPNPRSSNEGDDRTHLPGFLWGSKSQWISRPGPEHVHLVFSTGCDNLFLAYVGITVQRLETLLPDKGFLHSAFRFAICRASRASHPTFLYLGFLLCMV